MLLTVQWWTPASLLNRKCKYFCGSEEFLLFSPIYEIVKPLLTNCFEIVTQHMSNLWIIYFWGPANPNTDKISPVFLSLNNVLRPHSVIDFVTYHTSARDWSKSSPFLPHCFWHPCGSSQKPSLLYLAVIRLACGCKTFTSTFDLCEFGFWLESWQTATCQQFAGRIPPSSVSSSLNRKTRGGFCISKDYGAQGWFFKWKCWLLESLNIVLLLF